MQDVDICMKTRKELAKQCVYPFLPMRCVSVQKWKNQNIPIPFWLGGRLSNLSSKSFYLQAGAETVPCQVAKNASFYFDFSLKKKYLWKDICALLREGDFVSVYIESIKQHSVSVMKYQSKIKNIQSIVLTSIKLTECTLPKTYTNYKKWLTFITSLRQILHKMGLTPVETSSLVKCPGTEPHLEVFKTKKFIKNKCFSIFLPTSPEMALKKILCQGQTDIYEIKKCFRNDEQGEFNACEFYLLEWYRAHSDWHSLMDEVYEVLKNISKRWNNFPCPPLQKTSMRQLFKKYLNMDFTLNISRLDFVRKLKQMAIPFPAESSQSDLFHLLFLNGIEPYLDKSAPSVIYYYPLFEKAYARVDAFGARRFEFFWHGLELANGFDEVHTAAEQKLRFQADLLERRQIKRSTVPMDTELLKTMQMGMPPTVGVALGLDRLFLILNRLNNIHEIRGT